MPTVLRREDFASIFYSHEPHGPAHIRVDGGGASAKSWLRPLALARNHGFAARELRVIRDKIAVEQRHFEEAWNEYFGRQG
jgi:hypothetical protein